MKTESPRCRPTVLVCNGAFWPGNDASGVNQSLYGLAQALHNEFDFRILARDRPFGAGESVGQAGEWISLGYAQVRYCTPGRFGVESLRRLLRTTPHDVLMLNGFFDRDFTLPTLVAKRMGSVGGAPVIVSPRGEFSQGALDLKSLRKSSYIAVARGAGLLRDATLHATSAEELADIQRGFPWAGRYAVAPNVRAELKPLPHQEGPEGLVRVVFIGRLSRIKNLHFALDVLSKVRSPVSFDIYGPREDEAYWNECKALIAKFPNPMSVTVHGEISAAEVPAALATADLFFLPSRSENFGHAIYEALACGVLVLIGDQTPWRSLPDANAGWDLQLDRPQDFVAAVEALAAMPVSERARLSRGAVALAAAKLRDSDAVAASRTMLVGALARYSAPVAA